MNNQETPATLSAMHKTQIEHKQSKPKQKPKQQKTHKKTKHTHTHRYRKLKWCAKRNPLKMVTSSFFSLE